MLRIPKDWSMRITILPLINVFVTFHCEISHTYRGTVPKASVTPAGVLLVLFQFLY